MHLKIIIGSIKLFLVILTQVFVQPLYNFCLYSPWKKTIDNAFFFTFLALDLIQPKFWNKTTPTLIFFAGFQWNMLGNSININNFNLNPVVLKKKLKPLKITILWSPWAMPAKKTFFKEITKPDHTFSTTFYFITASYILADLCDAFLKCHFQPQQYETGLWSFRNFNIFQFFYQPTNSCFRTWNDSVTPAYII